MLRAVKKELGIDVGEATDDLRFSLEIVSCLGCCGQSPVMTVHGDIYGYLRENRIPGILQRYD